MLFHEQNAAVCLKATSRLKRYEDEPELMQGCVLVRASESDCFRKDTIVQADNLFPVRHSFLQEDTCIIGQLPQDFHEKIVAAIKVNIVLEPRRKQRLLQELSKG